VSESSSRKTADGNLSTALERAVLRYTQLGVLARPLTLSQELLRKKLLGLIYKFGLLNYFAVVFSESQFPL
jgi:hypothetical protein